MTEREHSNAASRYDETPEARKRLYTDSYEPVDLAAEKRDQSAASATHDQHCPARQGGTCTHEDGCLEPRSSSAAESCTRCGATPETGQSEGCPECEGVVGPLSVARSAAKDSERARDGDVGAADLGSRSQYPAQNAAVGRVPEPGVNRPGVNAPDPHASCERAATQLRSHAGLRELVALKAFSHLSVLTNLANPTRRGWGSR